MLPLKSEAVLYQISPSGEQQAASLSNRHRVIELCADFERGGAWAGVADLVKMAYLDLLAKKQLDILDEHHYALYMLLVEYRHAITLKYACLTETAQGSERTRNFPLDRAYRIVHSAVTLLSHWKSICAPDEQWAIVVRNFDRAQHLANRFFVELARRLTQRERFAVFASMPPDRTPSLEAARGLRLHVVSESISSVEMEAPAHSVNSSQADGALALDEDEVQDDMNAWERNYIGLLQKYRAQGDTFSVAEVALRTLCMYNHYGYYYEASSFVELVTPHLHALAGDDQQARWNYVGNIVQSLITTGKEEQGLALILQYAQPSLTDDVLIAKMHYLLAMMHLRYLKNKDVALAEQHINKALAHLQSAKADMSVDDFTFLHVFLNNGLAFVRMRQGRKSDASALCQTGFDVLTEAVGDAKHRLHRSVLLYNTAQVYVALGQLDEALKYYRDSIRMDPYYSEYHNEIGNILQRQGRFADALLAYDLAIKYSAPYPEVHFNKGICYSQLEKWDDALACLSFSAELNPDQPELFLLRAEVFEALGRTAEALTDYDTVIGLGEAPVAAWVNRAVLHYQFGQFEQALADMNHVIALEPNVATHYENRSEIHKAMNQPALVDADLAAAERYKETA